MKNPSLSIIIPVYNVKNYLNKCIDSILNQSYKDFEIILVDDGSTDGSGEICDEYSKMNSKIKVFHKKNNGQGSARNLGLDVCKGKYIGFVDSDDFIDPDMYESMIMILEEEDVDIVECGARNVYMDGTSAEHDDNIYLKFNNKECLDHYIRGNYFYTAVWNKLFKRNIITDIRFPEGMIFEDIYFTYHAYYKAKSIMYTSRCLYNYLAKRPNSTMNHGFDIREITNRLVLLKERMNFLYSKSLVEAADICRFNYYKDVLEVYTRTYSNEIQDKEYYLDLLRDEIRNNKGSIVKCRYKTIDKFRFTLFLINQKIFLKVTLLKRMTH